MAFSDEAEIAAFIAANGVTRLPRRSATAPPIRAVRRAVRQGRSITFRRGRSGRTVTFAPQPERGG